MDALGGKRSTSGRFACRRTTPKDGFQALTSKLTVYEISRYINRYVAGRHLDYSHTIPQVGPALQKQR